MYESLVRLDSDSSLQSIVDASLNEGALDDLPEGIGVVHGIGLH